MENFTRRTNGSDRDDAPRGATGEGARHKPSSLAPMAAEVVREEPPRAKARHDMLPWVFAITAVAAVASLALVYELNSPRLFHGEPAAGVPIVGEEDVFDHTGYGVLRSRSGAPDTASDFGSVAGGAEEGSGLVEADLASLAASLGAIEQQVIECAGGTQGADVKLHVTFHPTGYVSYVDMEDAPLVGDEAANCIMLAVMSATTPTFVGEELTIQHMVRLR